MRCGNKSYAIRLEIRAKRNRARTPESGERRVNDAMQRRVQKNGSKKVARRENAHTHKHTHTHTHTHTVMRERQTEWVSRQLSKGLDGWSLRDEKTTASDPSYSELWLASRELASAIYQLFLA